MPVALQHILLMQRNVPRAAKYYSEGLGMSLKVLTESWAELDAGGATVALKQADRRTSCFCSFVVIAPCSWHGKL